MPLSLISLMRLPGLAVASRWKVYWLAPAAAMGFTHCSGLDTIICMSVIKQRVSKASKHCKGLSNKQRLFNNSEREWKRERIHFSRSLTKLSQRGAAECMQLKCIRNKSRYNFSKTGTHQKMDQVRYSVVNIPP